jgi:hypothetical protein
MRLALGGQQLARLADHLFKYRYAKSGPQMVASSLAQPRPFRTAQHNNRVRQGRNTCARQCAYLFESARNRRGCERRGVLIPSVRKNPQRAARENAFMKPGDQDGRTGRWMDGVHKRVPPSTSGK